MVNSEYILPEEVTLLHFASFLSRDPLLPYFFGYKTGFFSFQNNPKVLDPSSKMDLELWHCLGRVELVL